MTTVKAIGIERTLIDVVSGKLYNLSHKLPKLEFGYFLITISKDKYRVIKVLEIYDIDQYFLSNFSLVLLPIIYSVVSQYSKYKKISEIINRKIKLISENPL